MHLNAQAHRKRFSTRLWRSSLDTSSGWLKNACSASACLTRCLSTLLRSLPTSQLNPSSTPISHLCILWSYTAMSSAPANAGYARPETGASFSASPALKGRDIPLIVVFDISNVLCAGTRAISTARRSTTKRGWALSSSRWRWFRRPYRTPRPISPPQSGASQGLSRIRRRIAPLPRALDRDPRHGPIDENVALLRRLKSAGRPVHALSNFATVEFAIARRRYDFLAAFDVAVISGHVGAVKPEARIYEILFDASGARPRTSCALTVAPQCPRR